MEVDIKPLAITTVPHTRLLRLAATWAALAVDVLRQTDIRNTGSILPDEMNMRIEDSGVHRLVVLTQQVLKVELVEVHALDQVPQSFRLKRGQTRVTDSCVCFKVSIVDSLDQLLRYLYNLLLTSFHILFLIGVTALCGALGSIDRIVHHCSLWLHRCRRGRVAFFHGVHYSAHYTVFSVVCLGLDSICLFVE